MEKKRNIFQRLFGGGSGTTIVAPASIVSSILSTPAGVSVNNDSAMKVTAFYAGIRIISENIAALPKLVKIYRNGDVANDYRSDIYRLLARRPNGYTNAFSFWSVIVTWIKGWGNAYVLIERNDAGEPIALHQVHPGNVMVTLSKGRKWYRMQFVDAELTRLTGTYSDDDVMHFMELTLDGVVGLNPVVYNARALGRSIATDDFASEFFAKGGNIRAVMETDGHLGNEEYNAFVNHFKQSSNNYDTPLLEYGIKYKQLAVDPVAEQLIQSQVLSIQDICRIVNIPPHMVAELSHATFSNIEHQTIQFVQYSLRPIVKRIETEIEAKLLPSDRSVKFVLDGLLRGDTAARSAYYHNAILDGYLSRNEVRDLEGYNKVDGLDEYLYPLNTGIVGEEPAADKSE